MPPVPVVLWHCGTRQQAESLGSGTNWQVTGTFSYFGHLKNMQAYFVMIHVYRLGVFSRIVRNTYLKMHKHCLIDNSVN